MVHETCPGHIYVDIAWEKAGFMAPIPGFELGEKVYDRAERVDAERPLSACDLLELAVAIADGICEIHAADVIHKDINPSNIVLVPGDPPPANRRLRHRLDTDPRGLQKLVKQLLGESEASLKRWRERLAEASTSFARSFLPMG